MSHKETNNLPDQPLIRHLPNETLGPNGDIPIATSALRVELDETTNQPKDAVFIYASKAFADAMGREIWGIEGHSYLKATEDSNQERLGQYYRAAYRGETVTGFEYNQLVRDWICYTISPSSRAGCCVYVFIPVAVSEDQLEQLMTSVDVRTSRFISDMLVELSAEQNYEDAMSGMLNILSTVIHSSRLCIFEASERTTKMSFELCAPGVEPQKTTTFALPRVALEKWFKTLAKEPVVLIPDTSVLINFSEPLFRWCQYTKTTSLMAAPFFSEGEFVGFLGAYNYQIDETIDLKRLFGAVSAFIGARIDNRRLIDSLAWASDHDALTGLYNRRGARKPINNLFKGLPNRPLVLALIDLDDFKKINDVHGHDAGDEALKTIARILTKSFPPGTIISRNGGDEFLVLLQDDGARNAHRLIAGLSTKSLTYEFEGEQFEMSVSIGYAVYPEQAKSSRDLYAMADDALYAVKLAGKAGYGKYVPGAGDQARSQLGFTPRDILDSFPYPVIVNAPEKGGAVIFASNALAHLLGYASKYELMRASRGRLANLVCAQDYRRVCELHAELAKQGTGHAVEFGLGIINKEGAEIAVKASSRLVTIPEAGKAIYSFLSLA